MRAYARINWWVSRAQLTQAVVGGACLGGTCRDDMAFAIFSVFFFPMKNSRLNLEPGQGVLIRLVRFPPRLTRAHRRVLHAVRTTLGHVTSSLTSLLSRGPSAAP